MELNSPIFIHISYGFWDYNTIHFVCHGQVSPIDFGWKWKHNRSYPYILQISYAPFAILYKI